MFSFSDQNEPSQGGNTATRVWTRRLIILLTILAAFVLAVLILNGASHITTALLIFAVAALIAYAIAPVVVIFQRVMPRWLAILLIYLLVFILLGLVMYLVVNTAVVQISSLAKNIGNMLTPSNNGQTPIIQLLKRFGLTDSQISALQQQLTTQLTQLAGGVAGGVLPIVSSIASALLNILLTIVISVYFLVDGSRAIRWLRDNSPASQRGRISFFISALQHVVGGYVRGQFTLSLIIGVIVGVGLAILRMPYAVLLGVLSFITEFIPVLGTIFAGVTAVLLALTQGWLEAVLVLAYFVVVHIIEGYVLAPRLVGKSVGLRPVVSLMALTIGAELFGPWGAIFAAPAAGLIQAIAVTFWTYYRRSHSKEFPPDQVESGAKAGEPLAATPTTPATPTADLSQKTNE
jgi:predicted PurR-regulated permease PerM